MYDYDVLCVHTSIHQDVFAIDVSAGIRGKQHHYTLDVVVVRHSA